MARPSNTTDSAESPRGANDSEGRDDESNRRLTIDLNDLDLQDLPEGPLDEEAFLSLCESNPKGLFEGLLQHLTIIEKRLAEGTDNTNDGVEGDVRAYVEEIANLKEQVKDHRQAMVELIEERDTAVASLRAVTGQTNTSEGGKKQKSTKLPDGQLLSDGIDPKYESWEIDVENKLEANADHYPTAQARLAYVKSMCKGEAANHLLPRFRKDSPQRYQDVSDIFEHLRTIYIDENRVINAKMELRRLTMRDMKFQTFLSKFALLAQESGLASSEWKEELYYKLSFEMQRAMIKESTDPTISYATFVQGCHTTANRLEQIAEGEKRAHGRRSGGNKNSGSNSGSSPATVDMKPKPGATRSNLSAEERRKLIDENKCFNCKLPGHRADKCPLKEKTPDLKALEPVTEPAEEQGKADA